MSHILVLNGSARPNAFTAAMIKSFRKGAELVEHTVKVIDLYKLNIRNCMGCLHGGKDWEHPCVQRDDMDIIYAEFRRADVTVFATRCFSGHTAVCSKMSLTGCGRWLNMNAANLSARGEAAHCWSQQAEVTPNRFMNISII